MRELKSDSPLGIRARMQEERLKRIATPGMIKVFASNENVRRLMKHPAGVGFRSALDQPVEWPRDAFTTRRINDGSVYVEGQSAPREERRGEGLGKRERVAARRPQAAAAAVAPVPPAPPPSAPAPAPASEKRPTPNK